MEAGVVAAFVEDHERELAVCRQASQTPAETDAERFVVCQLTSSVADHEGDFARAQMLWERTVELAEGLDRPRHLLWASEGASRAGHLGDGLQFASRAVRIARERGLVSTLPLALQVEASQLVGRGQFDLAYASARESQRLVADLGHPVAWSLADLATIDAVRGDEQQAREHASEAQAVVARSGARLLGRRTARALALLDLGLGQPSAALDRLLGSVLDMRPESDYVFVLGVPDAVEAASRSQRLDEVASRPRSLSAMLRADFQPRPPGPTRTLRGVGGRGRCRAPLPRCGRAFRRTVAIRPSADRAAVWRVAATPPQADRRTSPSSCSAGDLPTARHHAVGGSGTLRTARQRRDRTQARPLDPRSAHTAGVADLATCRLREVRTRRLPRSCSSARARSTTTCARSSPSWKSRRARNLPTWTSASPQPSDRRVARRPR